MFEVVQCPVYGCTDTGIGVPVHLVCCEPAAEVAALQSGITKARGDPDTFLLSCALDLLYAAGNKKGNLSINTTSFHFSLCHWPQKPVHTIPIRQRGWILIREKVSSHRMLLFSYLESLGSPGQFRSNGVRKQSPVVHAQCVRRFWYNRQHLWYRPSLMYGMASRDAQKV